MLIFNTKKVIKDKIMTITRRYFLKSLMMASASLFLLMLLPFKVKSKTKNPLIIKESASKGSASISAASSRKDKVSIVRCKSYEFSNVYKAVLQGIEDIKFKISRGSSVLLKPNIMAQNTPDQATTTHPAVIDAVCSIFSDYGCKVTIGDSSAFYQTGITRRGFDTTGIADVAKKYGAALLPFEATMLRKVTSGKVLNPFYITDAVFENDLVVDLPKLKLHRLARYTGAIKNLYGCIPGGTKQIYHALFNGRENYQEFWGKPIVDVYSAVSPGLTIMDAVVGLDEDGPASTGRPRQTGLVLVSENGAALDVVMCKIIGYDPLWVPAVREAVERKLTDPDKISVIGTMPLVAYAKLPSQKKKHGLSEKWDNYFFHQYIVEPRVKKGACIKCNDCIDKCAVKAISTDKKGYPVIDYEKCIYCYCCNEYCTHDAVKFHGSAMNHLIQGVRRVMKL